MLSNNIQKWLEKKGSFRAGFLLYKETGNQRYLIYFKQMLQRPFLPDEAPKLLAKTLRTYLVDHPPTLDASLSSIQSIKTAREEIPVPIQRLHSRGKSLLKQRDSLRSQLVQMAHDQDKYTDNDRLELARQIMDLLQPQIDEVYTKIRLWEDEGQIPSEESINSIVQDTVEKFKRVMSLRPAISRLKKRHAVENTGVEERKELEKEIRDKGIELHHLEDALGLQNTVLPSFEG